VTEKEETATCATGFACLEDACGVEVWTQGCNNGGVLNLVINAQLLELLWEVAPNSNISFDG